MLEEKRPVNPKPPVAFREEQKFRQWWVWLLVYGAAALAWYSFIQQIILGQPWGSNPAPDWAVWLIWLLIGLGFPIFFHVLKLVVEVDDRGVHIRYVPVLSRTVPFEEIDSCSSRTYNALAEFGGWGIRRRGSNRRAYNVSGNQGIELWLRDGKQIMLGTQKPNALERAVAAGLARSR
jgi:hypothetical protein